MVLIIYVLCVMNNKLAEKIRTLVAFSGILSFPRLTEILARSVCVWLFYWLPMILYCTVRSTYCSTVLFTVHSIHRMNNEEFILHSPRSLSLFHWWVQTLLPSILPETLSDFLHYHHFIESHYFLQSSTVLNLDHLPNEAKPFSFLLPLSILNN